MTLYVDQMFLENFIMNFIILYAAGKFSGKNGKLYRIAVASGIGAAYVISSYIFGFHDGGMITLKILLAVIMIFVAFSIKNIKDFLKLFISFLGITLLIGGASFGVAFFTNAVMIKEGGVIYIEEFPIFTITVGSVVSIIIIQWSGILLKNKLKLKNYIYNIEIKVLDQKTKTVVFLDSGHNVKEKFTGYPVIIAEKHVLKELIPDEIIEKAENDKFDFEEKWRRRLRIIPISDVNGKSDTLIGFRADECMIYMDSGIKYIKNPVIAGCSRQLDADNKYFALMGNILD